MRHLLIVLGLALFIGVPAHAQVVVGSGIPFVSSLPATCVPGITATVQLNHSPYTVNYCSATNTWTALTAGSGTVTSVTGTSPITSSGGATPAIACVTCETNGGTPLTSGTIPVAGTSPALTNGSLTDNGTGTLVGPSTHDLLFGSGGSSQNLVLSSTSSTYVNSGGYLVFGTPATPKWEMFSGGTGTFNLVVGLNGGLGDYALQIDGTAGYIGFKYIGAATSAPLCDNTTATSLAHSLTTCNGLTTGGAVTGATYATGTNCSSAAAPAACSAAAAGSVVLPTNAVSSSVVVNTSAVTANSQIFVMTDDTLGTKLSVTCNSTVATLVGGLTISARTAGTSFTISNNVAVVTNPLCVSYYIVN